MVICHHYLSTSIQNLKSLRSFSVLTSLLLMITLCVSSSPASLPARKWHENIENRVRRIRPRILANNPISEREHTFIQYVFQILCSNTTAENNLKNLFWKFFSNGGDTLARYLCFLFEEIFTIFSEDSQSWLHFQQLISESTGLW